MSLLINDGYYKITNKATNKVMDVPRACFSSNYNLICYALNGDNNQIFYFKNIEDDVYTIMASHSNKYLYAGEDKFLKQNDFKDASEFTIKQYSDYYKIMVNNSGMFLMTDNLDKVFQDNSKDTDYELWKIEAIEKRPHNPIALPNGHYIIRNKNSDKVLDIYGYNYGVSDVKQNALTLENNQIFYLESLDDGSFKIMATHSEMCFDVYQFSMNSGAKIKQYPWNKGDNQRFYIEQYTPGIYQLRSKASNKFLMIENSLKTDGANLIQQDQNNTDAQLFLFEKVKKNINNHPNYPFIQDGYYKIQNVSSKKVLDVYAFLMNDGTHLLQYDDNSGNNQIFYFKYLSYGAYTIMASHSNKYLTVRDASLNRGAAIEQKQLTDNSDNQIFFVEPYGSNFVLRAKHSNMVMDINAMNASNGERVQQWEQNNTLAQSFNLIPTTKNKYNFPEGIPPKKVILNVPIIAQRPELPTGCEITAVCMMLKFYGANVNKVSLANEMPKNISDPNLGFVGNPFTSSGWTIYPPALMNLVKKYVGSSINLTACSLDRLEEQIMNNKLVVVWLSNMYTFSVHALTMTGYDASYYYFNDPWNGIKNMSLTKADFLQKWTLQNKRAISY